MTRRKSAWQALDRVGHGIFITSLIIVPLVFDQNLVNWYNSSKQLAVAIFVLALLAVAALQFILLPRFAFNLSGLDWSVVVVAGISGVSALASVSRWGSLSGRTDSFVMNAAFLFSLLAFFWLVRRQASSVSRWQGVLKATVAIGGITAAVFVAKAALHFDSLEGLLGVTVWNTIDVTNSNFVVWLVVIFLLAAGLAVKKKCSPVWRLVSTGAVALSLVGILLAGFRPLWWVVLVASLVFVAAGFRSLLTIRLAGVAMAGGSAVLVGIFLLSGAPAGVPAVVPAEASLNAAASWRVIRPALASDIRNFLFGFGPGTFDIVFSQFRDRAFNADQAAWTLRFSRPFNTWFAWGVETGIAGFGALAAVVLVAARSFIRQSRRDPWSEYEPASTPEEGLNNITAVPEWDMTVAAIAWGVLTLSGALVFYGPVLWWLWWLLAGLLAAGMAPRRNARALIVSPNEQPEGLAARAGSYAPLGGFAALALIVISIIWNVRGYRAEEAFARGLAAANNQTREAELLTALRYQPRREAYYVALAQAYLRQAAAAGIFSEADLAARRAVAAGRQAVQLFSHSVVAWENLAVIYEQAATVVPDARERAVNSWREASLLEPANPIIWWRLGSNYEALGQTAEAERARQAARSLKPDYMPPDSSGPSAPASAGL